MSYNPVEAAEALQSIDQQTLNQYMRNPPPGIPAYQVAAEVARRADMAKRFAALDAKQKTDQQAGTVIDEVMRALNPGSVNPAPANPSQLASRPIPSNITGANAPMSPPAMQPPAMRPPVNAGIASGMQAQPALSPQVMQAAGGTMGRTVYARHGGVPQSPYARGSDALKKALEIAQGEGPLYSKSKRSFEGNLKDSYPEQERERRAMLALLTKEAVENRNRASGGMGVSAFASNGTQGRTVYAQFGTHGNQIGPRPAGSYELPPQPPGRELTGWEDVTARERLRQSLLAEGGADSLAGYPERKEAARKKREAELKARQLSGWRGPTVDYPSFHGPSGGELFDKQSTEVEMRRFGIDPSSQGALAALADAEQGQLDAAQAYREAQAERGTLFGELPRAAILEEQVRQREGRQLEARREADRIASLTPEHEALRMAQFASTPSNVRKTGREDFEAMADVHSQLAKGFDVPQIEDAVRAVDKAREVNIGQAIAKLRNGVPLNEDEIKALQNEGIDIQGAQRTLQEHRDIPSNMSGVRQNILTTPSVRADDANLDQLGAGGITSREDLARKYLAESGWAKPGVSGTTYGSAGEEFDYGHLSASEIIAIEKEQERDRLNKLAFEARYGDQTTGPSAGDARVDPQSGILTATADAAGATPEAEAVVDSAVEVKDAAAVTGGDDVADKVVPSDAAALEVDQTADSTKPNIETVVARRAQINAFRGGDTTSGSGQEGQLGEGFEPLAEVDTTGMREDLIGQLTEESNKHFTDLRAQIDKLKEYDPRADIEDVQQRRMDRIEQIKSDTNIQRLLAASAAFLGTSTFYEGFQKTMEELGALGKEEQKQVLALQNKIDDADLAARVAYANYQVKMTDTENAFAAARRADAQGNQRLAESHIQTAVASRAAANSLMAEAAKNANARLSLFIQQESVYHVKPTEAQTAMRELIDNVFVNGTEAERVAFGFTPNATNPGQLNLTVAGPQIGAHLKNVMPRSSSGMGAANFAMSVGRAQTDALEDIRTTWTKNQENLTTRKNTYPLREIEAFTGVSFPLADDGKGGKLNRLKSVRGDETAIAQQNRATLLWEAYQRYLNAGTDVERQAIFARYRELPSLIAAHEDRIKAIVEKQEGGEGSSANPADFVTK